MTEIWRKKKWKEKSNCVTTSQGKGKTVRALPERRNH